ATGRSSLGADTLSRRALRSGRLPERRERGEGSTDGFEAVPTRGIGKLLSRSREHARMLDTWAPLRDGNLRTGLYQDEAIMGRYRIVVARADCPGCGEAQEGRVQYKYGHPWQHEYRLGEPICWFDPPGRPAPLDDEGENVGGLVAVPGLVESRCSRCGRG